MRIAVVVLFLNEEEHLPSFLDSLGAQVRPPDCALLVDDGSTDSSAEIADSFAVNHPYAQVLRRPARGQERDRLATASVWTSFQWAVGEMGSDHDFDIVAKIDGDLVLTASLLAEIEERFTADPKLGLTGPYLAERDESGTLVRLRWRPEHVGGATKFYRRECYDAVYPLPPLLNLDMVDEVKARSLGWHTASFDARDGDPLHLRRHGTHDGALRGFRRWGRGDYVSGTHPLSVLFVGMQRLGRYPPVIGSLNYFLGWMLAAARRDPRFDSEIRSLRRQEQLARARTRFGDVMARRPGPRRS